MSFKRGRDPKESIGIGLKSEAIDVEQIIYIINENPTKVRNPRTIENFLQRLEIMDIPRDSVFGPQVILIESVQYGIIGIEKFAGRALKYRGKFYIIPSVKKIVEIGFEYLFSNEEEDKERREEEIKMQELRRKLMTTALTLKK